MQVQREPAQPNLEYLVILGVLTENCFLLQNPGEMLSREDLFLFYCCHILQSASLDMQPLGLDSHPNYGCMALVGMLRAANKLLPIAQVAQIAHARSHFNYLQKLTVGCPSQVFLQERWRQQKAPPCSSRDLILALEAAGALSPVILAHSNAEEKI